MSKTTQTLLLTALLFLTSAVNIRAQEHLSLLPPFSGQKSTVCDPLQSNLAVRTQSCDEPKLTQSEKAVKAAVKNIDEVEPVAFSYSLESAYYVPPTPTPSVSEPTPSPEEPTPLPSLQEAKDLFPAEGTSLDSNLIFDLINQHRAGIGKPAFLKDDALCSLAVTRSLELHDELFVNGNLHSGLYNRNLPYWITEDAKWGSNEAGTVRWWLNSPIHRRAIEGDYIYSCGACNGSQCSQLFTSYTPKVAVAPTSIPLEQPKQ